MTSCISQDAGFKSGCWKDAAGLPLPCTEQSFIQGIPELKESFNGDGHLVPVTVPKRPDTAVMGELVKLYAIWYALVYLCGFL
jgi:hypothetical protein